MDENEDWRKKAYWASLAEDMQWGRLALWLAIFIGGGWLLRTVW